MRKNRKHIPIDTNFIIPAKTFPHQIITLKSHETREELQNTDSFNIHT